jgi:transcriptional regulator with XRE-family HTH domain
MTFGKKVEQLRKAHNMTQSQFAKRFNLTQSTVSRLEKGERDVPDDVKIEIAKYFDVTLDFLLGKETSNEDIKNTITEDFGDDVTIHFYDTSEITREKIKKLKQIWELINKEDK